jgi:DNA-binding transcriptional regulator GbsR (MarR family)
MVIDNCGHMALEDFLGDTSEIKIIDFLADNMDCSYNQTEISENTGLSRTTVNQKIPCLIQNNIVVVDREVGKFKTFMLADNDLVKFLISASLAHSFGQAENPLSDEEQREKIKMLIGEYSVSEEDVEKAPENMIQMPIDGSIILTKEAAEKISKILDKKLKGKISPG